MSGEKVYILANLKINDKDAYKIYEKGFFSILKKHGGEFITFDDTPKTFEGSNPIENRMIIFSFPSPQNAEDWFNDPEYQDLAKNRRESSELKNLTMVKSLPLRSY